MNAPRRTARASFASLLTLLPSSIVAILAPAAWAAWLPANLQISPDVVTHLRSASVADGNGGEIVVFEEDSSRDHRSLRCPVALDGSLPWGSDGEPICQAAGNQRLPVIATDRRGRRDHRLAGPTFGRQRHLRTADQCCRVCLQWAADGVVVRGREQSDLSEDRE